MKKLLLIIFLFPQILLAMSGSTYAPQTWTDVQALWVKPTAEGISDSCVIGSSKVTDYVLTDDILIRGIEFYATGLSFGDTITIDVIDTNGITGLPPGTILNTPVKNWRLNAQDKMLKYESVAPLKGLATFTVRFTYNSVGFGLGSVNYAINLATMKVLK